MLLNSEAVGNFHAYIEYYQNQLSAFFGSRKHTREASKTLKFCYVTAKECDIATDMYF